MSPLGLVRVGHRRRALLRGARQLQSRLRARQPICRRGGSGGERTSRKPVCDGRRRGRARGRAQAGRRGPQPTAGPARRRQQEPSCPRGRPALRRGWRRARSSGGWCAAGSSGADVHRLISNLPGHRVELPDMAEGAGPQERPERRGSPDTGEQPVHRAVPQQAHILDRVIPATNAGTFKVKRKPSAITRLTRRRAPPVVASAQGRDDGRHGLRS